MGRLARRDRGRTDVVDRLRSVGAGRTVRRNGAHRKLIGRTGSQSAHRVGSSGSGTRNGPLTSASGDTVIDAIPGRAVHGSPAKAHAGRCVRKLDLRGRGNRVRNGLIFRADMQEIAVRVERRAIGRIHLRFIAVQSERQIILRKGVSGSGAQSHAQEIGLSAFEADLIGQRRRSAGSAVKPGQLIPVFRRDPACALDLIARFGRKGHFALCRLQNPVSSRSGHRGIGKLDGRDRSGSLDDNRLFSLYRSGLFCGNGSVALIPGRAEKSRLFRSRRAGLLQSLIHDLFRGQGRCFRFLGERRRSQGEER